MDSKIGIIYDNKYLRHDGVSIVNQTSRAFRSDIQIMAAHTHEFECSGRAFSNVIFTTRSQRPVVLRCNRVEVLK